jgi:hypothetical protein
MFKHTWLGSFYYTNNSLVICYSFAAAGRGGTSYKGQHSRVRATASGILGKSSVGDHAWCHTTPLFAQRDIVHARAAEEGRQVEHEVYVLTRPEDAVDENGNVTIVFTTDNLLRRQSELPSHAATDATYKVCHTVLH